MPIDPTTEELRSDLAELLAEAESDWERRKDDAELSKAERFSAGEVWALQKALKMMQPKPVPAQEATRTALAHFIETLDGREKDVWSTWWRDDLNAAFYKALDAEGYSIHYDGKPVAPSLNPVVDTGESLKVQLAKQINVLAKLLNGEGLIGRGLTEVMRTVGVQTGGLSPLLTDEPVAQLASYLHQIHKREFPETVRGVLSVLRHQYILSTDIGQAIDRLNELVSLVHESEA